MIWISGDMSVITETITTNTTNTTPISIIIIIIILREKKTLYRTEGKIKTECV